MRRATLGLLLVALIATACGTYGPPVRQSATAAGTTQRSPGTASPTGVAGPASPTDETAPANPTDPDRKR